MHFEELTSFEIKTNIDKIQLVERQEIQKS